MATRSRLLLGLQQAQRILRLNPTRHHTRLFSSQSEGSFSLPDVITSQRKKLIENEKKLLNDLVGALESVGLQQNDKTLLQRSIQSLDEFFLVTIVGEFNAGKSSLINALLGGAFCESGVTPTTASINILRYGPSISEISDENSVRTIFLPVPWLQNVNLVDTPGTNAILRHHEEVTEHFIPRSDLVVFVTSVDRPFSQSERAFCERILEWKKKIVLVVNKFDLLSNEAEQKQVLDFVRTNIKSLLHLEPIIFPVAARLALQAKEEQYIQNQNTTTDSPSGSQHISDMWGRSRFEAFQQYITRTLDDNTRIGYKLENPVGVAERLIHKYSQSVSERERALLEDVEAIASLQREITSFTDEVATEYRNRMTRIDNVLLQLLDRIDEFLNHHVQLSKIGSLVKGNNLRVAFEQEVMADFQNQMEELSQDLEKWLKERSQRQVQACSQYIQKRAHQYSHLIVGADLKSSHYDSNDARTLTTNTQRLLKSYHARNEGASVREQIQQGLMYSAALEVGAASVTAVALTTSLLHFTAFAGAGLMAVAGLYVLPYQRSRIQKQLKHQVHALRKQVDEALNRHLDRELDATVQHINDSLGPYSRYIRGQEARLKELSTNLNNLQSQFQNLRTSIRSTISSPTSSTSSTP